MSERTWKGSAMALPGIGASLMPKVVCPMCSAAYAALVSSLGLGFLMSTRYLLSLTAVFLAIGVVSLGYQASRRRGLGPFWLGIGAATCVLFGKFWFDSILTAYVGVGLFITASVWNVIPKRTFCPACLPTEAGSSK